jgi:RNA polymerase sigma-70 factor (ECF subfamily)
VGALAESRSDETLMASVANGDLSAFEVIVTRHQAAAWRIAFRFLGDAGDAEDLVQDAFLRLLSAADRYRPVAAFRTYFYRILTRLCLDHSRKRRPVPTAELPETPDGTPSASEYLLQAEREQAVRRALVELPTRDRLAVVLRYFDGCSAREMAEILDTSEKGVERLLSRARDRLKPTLGRWIEE